MLQLRYIFILRREYNLKRVALINDLSGFGRCSLGVNLPIISVFGHECCSLPTAILSNHTGFDNYSFFDFTDEMTDYYKNWSKLNIKFDCIYSGFLGSEKQIDITADFFRIFGENAIKIVDPVMGDNGKSYSTYTDKMKSNMKHLCQFADIITPNFTELMILLNKPYPTEKVSIKDIEKDILKLSKMGPSYIVVTGINSDITYNIENRKILNLGYDKKIDKFFCIEKEHILSSYCGTGDVFTSVLCGAYLKGYSFIKSVDKAAEFVKKCTKYTYENGGDILCGIQFEKHLKELK